VLRRVVCDGRCVVYDFDVADTGMRDLAVVVLTDASRSSAAAPRPQSACQRVSVSIVRRGGFHLGTLDVWPPSLPLTCGHQICL
jgi:hypothetical protein